jgi:hypothetical protein
MPYTGQEQDKIYEKKKVINMVNEKGYRNKPLTPDLSLLVRFNNIESEI